MLCRGGRGHAALAAALASPGGPGARLLRGLLLARASWAPVGAYLLAYLAALAAVDPKAELAEHLIDRNGLTFSVICLINAEDERNSYFALWAAVLTFAHAGAVRELEKFSCRLVQFYT